MRLSLIVPTLGTAPDLEARLATLKRALITGDEMILSGPGANLAPLATRLDAKLVTGPKGRGPQLQNGGAVAQGDWFLFLHDDTTLEEGWREAVEAFVTRTPDRAAAFTFTLDTKGLMPRFLEGAVALRCALFKLPYGDQGLLIARDFYEKLGGYKPILIMEDVDLVRRIGRRHLTILPQTAATSAQRYRRDGYLTRAARNLICLLLYFCGIRTERLIKFYF